MAVAKESLNKAKQQAYFTMMADAKKADLMLSPSIAKDYVNAAIAEHQYNFDICDRCRSTLDLTIEALRSCLSALKAEYSLTQRA